MHRLLSISEGVTRLARAGRMTCKVRFGLVSLFNGISTLFRLFNAKAILLEEQ